MSSFFAFVHHLAAFALVAALVVEFTSMRDALTVHTARRLLTADLAFGISAAVVLAVGLLRAFFFDKGAEYYFHSAPFIAKVTTFLLVGLVSIYPTLEFLSWRASLRAGRAPQVEPARLRRVRAIIHVELAGVVLILLFAALMARGVGMIG